MDVRVLGVGREHGSTKKIGIQRGCRWRVCGKENKIEALKELGLLEVLANDHISHCIGFSYLFHCNPSREKIRTTCDNTSCRRCIGDARAEHVKLARVR
jgi:hypothetical protein